MTASPTPDPRINPFLAALKSGNVQLLIGITTPSPHLVQMFAQSGFDAIMVDMEHGSIDIESCHTLITATRGTGATPLVRVPENEPWIVKRALDAGAKGIFFPMIKNREEAERAVRSVKYPPLGERGWGPFQTQYQWDVGMFEYSKIADDNIAVIILIEHPLAIENLDHILSVPGIDCAAVVPFDLAVNMGYRDGPGHLDVQDAIAAASEKIQAGGIPLAGLATTPEQANRMIDNGFRLIALGFDATFIPQAIAGVLGQIKRQ